MTRRTILFSATAIALGALAVLLALEGGLRVAESWRGGIVSLTILPSRMLVPSRIPGVPMELRPGFTAGGISIDGHGFRSPSFPVEKPPGETRIFVVGDSVAFGTGLSQEQTVTARLQERFDRGGERGPVRIVNAAVPGYNAPEILGTIEGKLGPFGPDLVVAYLNFTDVGCPAYIIPRGRLGPALFRHSALARATLGRIGSVQASRESFRRECFHVGSLTLARLLATGERDPARWLFVEAPKLDSPDDGPNGGSDGEYLHRQLAAHAVRRVDLAEVYRRRFGSLRGLQLSPTDGHPGPEANAAAADAIYERLIADGLPAPRPGAFPAAPLP